MTRILAIDQGTSSSRALLFDESLRPIAIAQQEFPQHYPRPGWVEHDPEDIWRSTLAVTREVLGTSGTDASEIAALGITNQRETAIVWDRITGKPVHNAIVWQDRRTAEECERLRAAGLEAEIAAKTGLRLDPYFSATKIAWTLDRVEGARARAESGELAFGTVDSFLLWRLTGGRVHATDATNASRTLLCDIHSGQFDPALCEIFGVPTALLPQIRDCAADYGTTAPEIFGGGIGIAGIAGDQQAATIGQGCFAPGLVKSTYGTGAFMLLNTGDTPIASKNRLLTTIAYQLNGKRTYALEGAIFVAGQAVKWLRDGMGLIASAAESEVLAAAADPAQAVYFVPALAGLGAPYWDANARGAIFGITAATGPREIARATLESVAYQTRDLLEAMRADGAHDIRTLRVDGGMVANEWLLQFLADMLGCAVEVPEVLETTALGAAYLAGLTAGVCPAADAFAAENRNRRRYAPKMDETERARKYRGWKDAIARTLTQRR